MVLQLGVTKNLEKLDTHVQVLQNPFATLQPSFYFCLWNQCKRKTNCNMWFSSVEKLGLNTLTKRYHFVYKSSEVDLDWLETPFSQKLEAQC
jgi:hypothetical protein